MKNKDNKIKAPLITIESYFIIFGILFLGTVIQVLLVVYLTKTTVTAVVILIVIYIVNCLLVSLAFGISRRYMYEKPIRNLAISARKVAQGDFDAEIEISKKKKKNDEIGVLIDDFNVMVQELKSTEILKSDFISNVSHEIKTPLSIIQNYAQALKQDDLSDEEKINYVNVITQTCNSLNTMITNILRLNKLENQKIRQVPETYPLSEQLRRCALNFMELWEKKNINFEIDVEDIFIKYDSTMLEIVWNNLLSNAIKFTQPYGHIKLSCKKSNNEAVVIVEDDGEGITEEDMKHIFDKFYQKDSSHATEGNGLGLSLAKKIIEVVNGRIEVESSLNKGSKFIVYLPL